MKGALIFMGLIGAVLVVLLWQKGDGAFAAAGKSALGTGAKFLPILAFAFLIMGAIEVLLPQGFVDGWLSDAAGFKGIVTAWIAGLLTPAGNIVGLPIAGGLFQAGVSPAVLVTYVSSLSLLALVKLPIEVGFLGMRLAVLRYLVCIPLPLLAGVLTRVVTNWVRLSPV